LNASLEAIDGSAPRTHRAAYRAAQKALKPSEELFFTDEKLNKRLPKQWRARSNRRIRQGLAKSSMLFRD
jgi:hypothetical protein